MNVRTINYKTWNKKVENEKELSTATENDIFFKIDNLYCCCETKNGSNNIMVFSEKTDIKNIKRIFMFICILYYAYDIRYITVVGNLKRYRFLEKKFKENVVRDPTINDRRVLYIKLNEEKIMELKENEI